MYRFMRIAGALAFLLTAASASAQVVEQKGLTLEAARRVVAAAVGEATGPNGVAFSPDERFLYVTHWDTAKKVVMRYPVNADGRLGAGEVFFDMTSAPGEEALDGIKVDRAGNLFVSGWGGAWIISPEGKHLGTIEAPELPANFAWGDADGRTLYMTARTGLYRIRTRVPGLRPELRPS